MRCSAYMPSARRTLSSSGRLCNRRKASADLGRPWPVMASHGWPWPAKASQVLDFGHEMVRNATPRENSGLKRNLSPNRAYPAPIRKIGSFTTALLWKFARPPSTRPPSVIPRKAGQGWPWPGAKPLTRLRYRSTGKWKRAS